MSGDELLSMIWDALGDEEVTTGEASARLESVFGYRCPDDIAKTFMKYRRLGYVKGKVSMEKGGWVWWADEECRSKEVQRWHRVIRMRISKPPGGMFSPGTSTVS